MKLLLLAAVAATSLAQNIDIRSPRSGSTIHRDRPTPVTVQTHNNGTAVQELSIVLSILSCPDWNCPNAGENLGTLLYQGAFNPVGTTPEQTFNVTVPASFPVGPAQLLATHFLLLGASVLELKQKHDGIRADGVQEGHSPRLQIGGIGLFAV